MLPMREGLQLRRCTRCGREKPLEQFLRARSKPHGRDYTCRDCGTVANLSPEEREARRASGRAATARYRERHGPERRDPGRQRRYALMTRFGITPAEVEAIREDQDGRCPICEAELPERVALDHDPRHPNRNVRGLLCDQCNLKLGQWGEDPERLRRAIAYLERPPAFVSDLPAYHRRPGQRGRRRVEDR